MIIVYIFTFTYLYVHTCTCNLVGLGWRGLGASSLEVQSRINQLQSQVDEAKAIVSDLFTVYMYKQCGLICTCII